MQVSSIYRRGLVLPLDAEAEESLRYNDISERTSLRYLEIPDQSFFEQLWELGLFHDVNARTGSLIDDYEEEFIEPTDIGSILDAVNEVRLKEGAQIPEMQFFLSNLSGLASSAAKLQRPLLFIL